MKKVLFTAKVDSHILNFHIPYLKWFKDQGYEVHVASNGENDIPYTDFKYNLKFDRNPLKPSNFKAYLELKKMIDGQLEVLERKAQKSCIQHMVFISMREHQSLTGLYIIM